MPRRLRRILLFVGTGLLSGLACLLLADWWFCLPEGRVAEYVGRAECLRCHEPEHHDWVGSHHHLAMDYATEETVRGDFDDAEHRHFDVRSRMYRRDGKYYMYTEGPDGEMAEFEIKYTFGWEPLQQYLVEFPDGRVQCLPIAWATEEDRWFHLYPDERIPHDDELFWTGPLQNWNYMCAECHTTDLQKNYDLATDTYHTTFADINVSCETCHGPGSIHVELSDSWGYFWDRRYGYGLPELKSEDHRVEIETCAPCHARRRHIYPGWKAGERLLDYFLPELLDAEGIYYADGQILDENFEYSSFILSEMYHEGVRCTDCHDPHTLELKYDGNALCNQCHVAGQYDTPLHHHHPDATQPGTACVDCHMPQTTYMVADPRRDHAFDSPRPQLTIDLGIPNACTGCHDDPEEGETVEWAQEHIEKWYGPAKGPPHFAYAIAAGREQSAEGHRLLLNLLRRRDVTPIVRASALILLGRYQTTEAHFMAIAALDDAEDLVRFAAVRALDGLPLEELPRRLAPRLTDSVRAVRIEAARILARVPQHRFSPRDYEAFLAALAEYRKGLEFLDDQPAAHLNRAVLHADLGDIDAALDAYQTALRIDPRFVPARINLGMLHDELGRREEAEAQFRKAIEVRPDLAEVHYSLGLLVAEDEERLAEAAEILARATSLDPDHPRMHYNLGLALQRLGRHEEAEQALTRALELDPRGLDYYAALAIFYAQQERWVRALAVVDEGTRRAEDALRRQPGDPQAAARLREFRQQAEFFRGQR